MWVIKSIRRVSKIATAGNELVETVVAAQNTAIGTATNVTATGAEHLINTTPDRALNRLRQRQQILHDK
jgi:hypothetical protein